MTKRITQEQRDAFALVGSMGGKATFKKIGKKGMKELGEKGAAKRLANIKARADLKK